MARLLQDPKGKVNGSEGAIRSTCIIALVLPLCLLVILFADALIDGAPRLNVDFLTGLPSRRAESAGILPPLVGSLFLMILTAAIAMPIGIGAAIYLEEYAKPSRFTTFVEMNIATLAGVPSIIYGLLGLEVFVRVMSMDRTLIAGACTLALLLLPMVIIASREALRTVPHSLREASFALGADQWRTVKKVVLPMSVPGIMTGVILSLARAIGETAPLITLGALTYITTVPTGLKSQFTALPIQIFNWISRPQEDFRVNAAAGIVVLLAMLFVLNLSAIIVRNRLQKRIA